MARTAVKVVIDPNGLSEFLQRNKAIRDILVGTATRVAATAQSTADSAQKGSGGKITGYAEAGFSVQWQARGGKRPRVNIVSNADPKTFMRAYWYTQKRDGVTHLRKALYTHTFRG